ncbi:MAG: hypothetical protein EOM62_16845 [Bacteroidia bacterium]|nr:hypothetical protein [Bacteroidia bacterium]
MFYGGSESATTPVMCRRYGNPLYKAAAAKLSSLPKSDKMSLPLYKAKQRSSCHSSLVTRHSQKRQDVASTIQSEAAKLSSLPKSDKMSLPLYKAKQRSSRHSLLVTRHFQKATRCRFHYTKRSSEALVTGHSSLPKSDKMSLPLYKAKQRSSNP